MNLRFTNMETALIIIAIIAVLGLIATIAIQGYMLFKAHAYFMVAKNPQAYVEIMKSRDEKQYERTEKKKTQVAAAAHKRFKDIINSGEATDDQIKEFNTQGNKK